MTDETSRSTPVLAGDILRGAEEIAAFLCGDARHRRKVYHLVAAKRLPHFRLGASLCARRSILLDWIVAQEQASDSGAST